MMRIWVLAAICVLFNCDRAQDNEFQELTKFRNAVLSRDQAAFEKMLMYKKAGAPATPLLETYGRTGDLSTRPLRGSLDRLERFFRAHLITADDVTFDRVALRHLGFSEKPEDGAVLTLTDYRPIKVTVTYKARDGSTVRIMEFVMWNQLKMENGLGSDARGGVNPPVYSYFFGDISLYPIND